MIQLQGPIVAVVWIEKEAEADRILGMSFKFRFDCFMKESKDITT